MANERTRYEQETIINFNNEEDTASVYTWNKPLIRKLMRHLEDRNDITLESGDEECATFIVPKKWIKVSPPRQVNLSDEQRQANAERLRNARLGQLSQDE